MSQTSLSVERKALRLALTLAASADCRISRNALTDHFGAEADLLISMGILRPDGYITSIAREDDDPVAVEWFAERGCFGFFCDTEGWVALENDGLTVFALQILPLVKLLTAGMDLQPKATATELRPGLLWEFGSCRLPERSKRVSLWVARRLHDPDAWHAFAQTTRDRPTQDTRLVLHLADHEDHLSPFVANHAIIAVGSVISDANPFQIDPHIAAARLQTPNIAKGPITLSANGGSLVVNGKNYVFRGGKHRAIVRFLYEALDRGKPRCLTEEVLFEAECAESTRRLARAFKGHPSWHEVIKEQGGFCWLEA